MNRRDELVSRAKSLLTQSETEVPAPPPGSASVPLDLETLQRHSVALAEVLLELAHSFETRDFKKRNERLSRMMDDPRGQALTTLLTDRAYRTHDAKQTLGQLQSLVEKLGIPRFLTALERGKFSLLSTGAALAPELTHRSLLAEIQKQTGAYIRSAEPDALGEYLEARTGQGIRVNVNYLGEEVLGETEAQRRVDGYVRLLKHPQVNTISVKISSICSQLDVLAFEQSVATICERLSPIFAAAMSTPEPKLVYLDMEAYRDLPLTLAAYQRLLDEPRFLGLTAGVALQAYLPDSFGALTQLTQWSLKRTALGGSPIRVRIVKGANLATESVVSNHRGWELPIYPSKAQVDANYKAMLLKAASLEFEGSVNVGIATHNLFDLCFGLTLSRSLKGRSGLELELLEGMAEPLLQALVQLDVPLLVYAPVVEPEEFPSAVAYLVRRLDENTADENYLRHSFGLKVGDPAWEEQKARFIEACSLITRLDHTPRRKPAPPPSPSSVESPFGNTPDTDFILEANRSAVHRALNARQTAEERCIESQILNTAPGTDLRRHGFDPSVPASVPYYYRLADEAQVEQALANAELAVQAWANTPLRERQELLLKVAQKLKEHRFALISAMVQDAGKRIEEADIEVSEAIDFAEFYARSAAEVHESSHTAWLEPKPLGPCVITPPWNFPLAIPFGGTLAALVMGNPVILKPALETPLVAHTAAELCWQAGVPKQVLQLVLCDDEVGTRLITDPRVQAVVLTGASSTARLFQKLRPNLNLFAETGGKNALYVSPLADREQAISDIVMSAFAHAGQKCSALSQLILHKEVYHDSIFIKTLADAATSLKVGSAWDLSSKVTPMIQPPNALQRKALTQLTPGESWLVKPHFSENNARLVSPGIKLGVAPGSKSHQTEFFCPLLSVLRADSLEHALEIANGTPYGLTSGIHSLDEREQAAWARGIQAGNVYVNRKITGAIVRRQPFGGWKSSGFGPGAKAGGPNYLTQFVKLEPRPGQSAPRPTNQEQNVASLKTALTSLPSDLRALALEYESLYAAGFAEHFAQAQDPSQLSGEDNRFEHHPLTGYLLLALGDAPETQEQQDHLTQRMLRQLVAAHACGTPITLRVQQELMQSAGIQDVVKAFDGQFFEEEQELVDLLKEPRFERTGCIGDCPVSLLQLIHERDLHLERRPLRLLPRFDLLHFLKERSLCVTTHRYGNLAPTLLK